MTQSVHVATWPAAVHAAYFAVANLNAALPLAARLEFDAVLDAWACQGSTPLKVLVNARLAGPTATAVGKFVVAVTSRSGMVGDDATPVAVLSSSLAVTAGDTFVTVGPGGAAGPPEPVVAAQMPDVIKTTRAFIRGLTSASAPTPAAAAAAENPKAKAMTISPTREIRSFRDDAGWASSTPVSVVAVASATAQNWVDFSVAHAFANMAVRYVVELTIEREAGTVDDAVVTFLYQQPLAGAPVFDAVSFTATRKSRDSGTFVTPFNTWQAARDTATAAMAGDPATVLGEDGGEAWSLALVWRAAISGSFNPSGVRPKSPRRWLVTAVFRGASSGRLVLSKITAMGTFDGTSTTTPVVAATHVEIDRTGGWWRAAAAAAGVEP
jgi:hypothetical protein